MLIAFDCYSVFLFALIQLHWLTGHKTPSYLLTLFLFESWKTSLPDGDQILDK